MKRLLILSIIFLTVSLFNTVFAQRTEPKLIIITLDKDNRNFAKPLDAVVIPGDTIQFKTINGDFAIYIENAISLLWVEEVNLTLELTSSKPESEFFIVRLANDETFFKPYSTFCITTKSWPKDAPPRIIIVSQ